MKFKGLTTDWRRNRPANSLRRLAFVKENPAVFTNNAITKIKSIIFQDHLTKAIGATMDISANHDGSVCAYLSRDCSTLYIGAKGGINAEKCEFLFDGLNSVERIEFEDHSFHTDEATDFTCMFANCRKLKTLNVRDFNTSKAESFGDMFHGCESLTTLNLKGFDTSSSTDFRDMFSGCRSLELLDITSFQIHLAVRWAKYFDERCDSVWFRVPPKISGMFSGCESLKSLDLRSFNTCDVNHFTKLFENCASLETLLLSKSFVIRSDTDTSLMFAGCKKLDIAGLGLNLTPKQAEDAL